VEVPAVLIATKKNFAPNSVPELVEHARKAPGTFFYNTAGVLSYSHLDMLELQKRAGIKLDMVPLSAGGGSGQMDIISGEVHMALRNVASAASFIRNGQVKALAVTTEERLPSFPDVPTMKEQGYAGLGTNAWQAMFVSSKTPPDIVNRLHAAVRAALQDPLVQKRLEEQQMLITPSADVAAAQQWLDSEFSHWERATADVKDLPEERR
jgi:tripartite-type tricarboxylate transporter receptor subunit TctC